VKAIALFLFIVVLSLTVMPCCAVKETVRHTAEAANLQKHDCNEEQPDDCCKDCSPFYVCGTCVGFVFFMQQTIIFALPVIPLKHSAFYIPVKLNHIPTAIWQPPKLF